MKVKLYTWFLTIVIIVMSTSSCIKIEYGHHFAFTNELNRNIDSIQISIGDSTTILNDPDTVTFDFEANIVVPKTGYPHHVAIVIYSNDSIFEIPSDSFNCYNCDGGHEYILRSDGNKYVFHN
jgi:hypothetical protein